MIRSPARHAASLLALSCIAPVACAQGLITRTTPPETAVDAIFKRYDKQDMPGCSVAVIDDGRLLLKKSYGMADPSLGVPMSSTTNVWIPYSETRVFVALAVAQLARDGKFSLDDPIRKHVPEVPAYASAVTVRQLLHHTSGLPDYGVLRGPGADIEDPMSEDEFFRVVSRWGKLGFAPGQSHLYSNTDYAFLKILVERISGGSLHAYLQPRVLTPLGMSATRIGADQADIHPGHALFYRPDGDGFERVLRYRVTPTGGISVTTSLDDLLKWERALRDPARGFGEMLRDLEPGAPPPAGDADATGFQFGVYRRTHKGLPLVEYRGVGWYTYLVQVPDTRLSVATLCLTNVDTGWLGADVARLYAAPAVVLQAAAAPPAPRALGQPVDVPAADLQRYVGEYRTANARTVIDVGVAAGALTITPRGRPTLPELVALGNGQFKAMLGGDTFLFEFKDEPEGMTLSSWDVTNNESGGETVRRGTPWTPDAKALAHYAGTYDGDDVEVTLHVRSDDDRILVSARGMTETALAPSNKPDSFTGPDIYTTRFERDTSGRVVALVLDATRVKGMRYTKR